MIRTLRTFALIFALTSACLMASCITKRVIHPTMFPALDFAWVQVREDVLRGIEDGRATEELHAFEAAQLSSNVTHLGAALAARDLPAMRQAPWETLRPWGKRGIEAQLEAGEIGPGVALSLHEQLYNFSETWRRITE